MTITIDGHEVTRDDGTVRCIGYGEDKDEKVTGRFALPKGDEWDAPEATEGVHYVDTLDDLPPINDEYRNPPR